MGDLVFNSPRSQINNGENSIFKMELKNYKIMCIILEKDI